MKDFIMLFHSEPDPNMEPTPEELQTEIQAWQKWMEGIAATGKLKNPGEALGFEGKTVHADGTTTDGPYAELKEIVGGFIVVSTETLEEAVKLVPGCPALDTGGKVEVREIMNIDM